MFSILSAIAAIILSTNQPQVTQSLAQFWYQVPATGVYSVSFQSLFQTGSDLGVQVSNGTLAIYTSPVPGPVQTAMQFHVPFIASARDTIAVSLASSLAVDNTPNNVKSIVSVNQGL